MIKKLIPILLLLSCLAAGAQPFLPVATDTNGRLANIINLRSTNFFDTNMSFFMRALTNGGFNSWFISANSTAQEFGNKTLTNSFVKGGGSTNFGLTNAYGSIIDPFFITSGAQGPLITNISGSTSPTLDFGNADSDGFNAIHFYFGGTFYGQIRMDTNDFLLSYKAKNFISISGTNLTLGDAGAVVEIPSSPLNIAGKISSGATGSSNVVYHSQSGPLMFDPLGSYTGMVTASNNNAQLSTNVVTLLSGHSGATALVGLRTGDGYPQAGRRAEIENGGTGAITLHDESGLVDPTNRLATGGGLQVVIEAGGRAVLEWATGVSRWVVVSPQPVTATATNVVQQPVGDTNATHHTLITTNHTSGALQQKTLSPGNNVVIDNQNTNLQIGLPPVLIETNINGTASTALNTNVLLHTNAAVWVFSSGTGTNFTLTLPTNTVVADGMKFQIVLNADGTNFLNITPTNAPSLATADKIHKSTNFIITPGMSLTIQQVGTNWNIIEGLPSIPIGGYVDYHPNLAGVCATPSSFFKKCDGTAVSDAGSPLNGVTLPNFTNNVFARYSATSGGTGGSETHAHGDGSTGVPSATFTVDANIDGTTLVVATDTHTHGVFGAPATNSLPPYINTVRLIRIK